MEVNYNFFDNITLSYLLKIVLSIMLGTIIGLEREIKSKFAGLKTHILVSLGACIFTILSIDAFPSVLTENPNYIGDPARIAAQIVTGIGFIGGGTVLRHGGNIYGLTTAATLWLSASVGMACGSSQYKLAILSTLIAIFLLIIIRKLEKTFLSSISRQRKKFKVIILFDESYKDEVKTQLLKEFDNIFEISYKKSERDDSLGKFVIKISIIENNAINIVYERLEIIKQIETITVSEIYE